MVPGYPLPTHTPDGIRSTFMTRVMTRGVVLDSRRRRARRSSPEPPPPQRGIPGICTCPAAPCTRERAESLQLGGVRSSSLLLLRIARYRRASPRGAPGRSVPVFIHEQTRRSSRGLYAHAPKLNSEGQPGRVDYTRTQLSNTSPWAALGDALATEFTEQRASDYTHDT